MNKILTDEQRREVVKYRMENAEKTLAIPHSFTVIPQRTHTHLWVRFSAFILCFFALNCTFFVKILAYSKIKLYLCTRNRIA